MSETEFMGVAKHCYKEISPELLANLVPGPNTEKFKANTIDSGQHNFWKPVFQ